VPKYGKYGKTYKTTTRERVGAPVQNLKRVLSVLLKYFEIFLPPTGAGDGTDVLQSETLDTQEPLKGSPSRSIRRHPTRQNARQGP
jgi:hypothetical protein